MANPPDLPDDPDARRIALEERATYEAAVDRALNEMDEVLTTDRVEQIRRIASERPLEGAVMRHWLENIGPSCLVRTSMSGVAILHMDHVCRAEYHAHQEGFMFTAPELLEWHQGLEVNNIDRIRLLPTMVQIEADGRVIGQLHLTTDHLPEVRLQMAAEMIDAFTTLLVTSGELDGVREVVIHDDEWMVVS